MSQAIYDKFIYNNQLFNSSDFKHVFVDTAPSVYEVIRIVNRVPLFFEEHYNRLLHSATLLNHTIEIQAERIKAHIIEMIQVNNITDCNIKIVINKLNSKDFNQYYYFIKSDYPDATMYLSGVNTITYHAVRKNPNAKVIYQSMRDEINTLLKNKGCYEAILVNDSNHITEGSRSNLFFIGKDNCLYTAPANEVLIGVTRKRIITLCELNNIKVFETQISANTINEFAACFISGTSPKILPVRTIDNHLYSTDHFVLKSIMKLYDDEIKRYIQEYKIK